MLFHVERAAFPAGTTVGVYAEQDAVAAQARSAPRTIPIRTAVVATDGSIDYSGLDPDTAYFLAAQVSGSWLWVKFRTAASLTARYANEDPEDVPFRTDAPAGQTADVFQQFIGESKVVWIDGDGVLHLTGVNADGDVLQKTVRVDSLGNLAGSAIVDLADESEVWVFLTLTGNSTLTFQNLEPGRPVRLFVTRDASATEYTLTISNLTVSTDAELDRNPSSTTVLSIYAEEADDLIIAGGSKARPSRALSADSEVLGTDAGRLLAFATATNPKLHIAAGLALVSGDEVRISQTGPGQVRVTAETGVTVWSDGFLRGISRGCRAVLLCVGPDEYILAGSLSSVYAATAGVPDAVTAVPNKTLWLDSLQLPLSEGDAITPFTDKSGAAHNATQATSGMRALYRKGKINGLPSAVYDGIDDWYTVAAIHADDATRTFWAVAACTSLTGRDYVWALTDQGHGIFIESGRWKFGKNEAAAAEDLGAASALDIVCLRFNSVSSADFYINGVLTKNFNPDDGYSTSAGLNLGIGAANNGDGSTVFAGSLPEVLLSNDACTDPVVDAVNAYLIAKYGK